jgi:hypothetical protein
MTVSYSLGQEPIWIFINNEGTAAGGAKMYTKRSLNKIEDKPVYMDPAGAQAWTNPIDVDLNGTKGPFYFAVDDAAPEDTYYIFVNDSEGNLIWDADNYVPGGDGGGSVITTFLSLKNYITNNQFIDHIPDTSNPINSTNLVIAPSNHKGFTPALVNPIVGTYGVVGPDIRFVKNNTTAADEITFPLFALASAPLTGDVTPVDYVRYQSNGVVGETFKAFQFPITQKVKNLSNQDMTFTIWAASGSGTPAINIYVRQYYGSGTAATADTRTLRGTCNLTTTWTPFNIQFTVPSVAAGSIGTPGLQTDDDAVYIQIEMPLNQACEIYFTKPCLYLDTIDPELEFDSYDEIDSVNSTPRTGDVKTSLLSSAPLGWLPMNDGTIGNVGSGADTEGAYTFALYKTLWDGVDNAWAPVSTGRGGTAVADFLAGKTLTLPLSLGRALAGAGSGSGLPVYALGENAGNPTTTLVSGNLPPHQHSTTIPYTVVGTMDGPAGAFSRATTANTAYVSGNGPGTSTPFDIIQPSSFMNVFIKL